jgi:hypothetical protein
MKRDQNLFEQRQTYNLVPRTFCFRGWMVSEKGPGFGWSVLKPDCMVNDFEWNYSIYVGIIIILVERESL